MLERACSQISLGAAQRTRELLIYLLGRSITCNSTMGKKACLALDLEYDCVEVYDVGYDVLDDDGAGNQRDASSKLILEYLFSLQYSQ